MKPGPLHRRGFSRRPLHHLNTRRQPLSDVWRHHGARPGLGEELSGPHLEGLLLHQTSDFKLFGCKHWGENTLSCSSISRHTCVHENVELLAGDGDLPVVHEIQDRDDVLEPDVVWHDQHWTVGPRMFLQHRLEVGRTSRYDDFMSLNLLFFSTGDGNVQKLFISPQIFESGGDILVKVLPLQRIILLHS